MSSEDKMNTSFTPPITAQSVKRKRDLVERQDEEIRLYLKRLQDEDHVFSQKLAAQSQLKRDLGFGSRQSSMSFAKEGIASPDDKSDGTQSCVRLHSELRASQASAPSTLVSKGSQSLIVRLRLPSLSTSNTSRRSMNSSIIRHISCSGVSSVEISDSDDDSLPLRFNRASRPFKKVSIEPGNGDANESERAENSVCISSNPSLATQLSDSAVLEHIRVLALEDVNLSKELTHKLAEHLRICMTWKKLRARKLILWNHNNQRDGRAVCVRSRQFFLFTNDYDRRYGDTACPRCIRDQVFCIRVKMGEELPFLLPLPESMRKETKPGSLDYWVLRHPASASTGSFEH